MKKKVLFIGLNIYCRVGGMERYNQRVLRSLSELHASSISEIRAISLWDPPAQNIQIPAHVSFIPCSNNKLKTLFAFARSSLEMQPDIFLYGHILLAPLAIVARILCPRARQILCVHGIDVWGEPKYRATPFWEPMLVRLFIDKVLSVSGFTQRKMTCVYKIPQQKFRIIPNSVDINKDGIGSQTSEIKKSPHFLTVTRLSEKDRYKGCDKIIRALPRILELHPDAVYDLVGEGPLKRELQQLAKSLGVEEHVKFRGYVSDDELMQLYNTSQFFVLPSSGEGFGIVFLEAWQYHLPVIAGNRDASAELITDGYDGFTVDPDLIEAIAEAIIKLLSNPQTVQQMGWNGYQTVLTHYTHEQFRQKFAQVLEET